MKALFAALAALALAVPIQSDAAEPIANAGRLTCTVDPLPAGATSSTRDLSCVFEPISGVKSNYTGSVKRVDGPRLVDDTIVFAWTVLAPERELAQGALTGRYLSSLTEARSPSAMKVGSLRRDAEVPIELRALTMASRGEDKPTIILELDLAAARA